MAVFKGNWIDRPLLVKALSFGVVGVLNSAVDFTIFSLAFFAFGLPIIAANIAAWIVAVTGSYVMNAKTTFAEESGRELSVKAYLGFAFSQLGGFAANTATVFVASYFMPVVFGKILAIGASFAVNFSLSYFVIFRRRDGAP
jgi:putative flippase GtrA